MGILQGKGEKKIESQDRLKLGLKVQIVSAGGGEGFTDTKGGGKRIRHSNADNR